jgi:hypothetical protein
MKLRSILSTALLLLWPMRMFSQGCAMCYSNAAGASQDGQRAIRHGVEVLLFPPLGVMTMGVWMAFRYARKRDREKNSASGDLLPASPRNASVSRRASRDTNYHAP